MHTAALLWGTNTVINSNSIASHKLSHSHFPVLILSSLPFSSLTDLTWLGLPSFRLTHHLKLPLNLNSVHVYPPMVHGYT